MNNTLNGDNSRYAATQGYDYHVAIASFFAAALGAVSLEVIHWYNIREELHLQKYQRLIRSPSYWIPTILATLLGAIIVPVYFGAGLRLDQLLIAGAAFPTTIRKIIGTGLAAEKTRLGAERPEPKVGFRDYFLVSKG
jgi:H+/Cl- antiporter ClcA